MATTTTRGKKTPPKKLNVDKIFDNALVRHEEALTTGRRQVEIIDEDHDDYQTIAQAISNGEVTAVIPATIAEEHVVYRLALLSSAKHIGVTNPNNDGEVFDRYAITCRDAHTNQTLRAWIIVPFTEDKSNAPQPGESWNIPTWLAVEGTIIINPVKKVFIRVLKNCWQSAYARAERVKDELVQSFYALTKGVTITAETAETVDV